LPGVYNYCFQVTDPSGNRSVKVCRTIEVKESTSGIISSDQNDKIRLYPNPNSGSFMLDLSGINDKVAIIELFDNTGKMVYNTNLPAVKNNLNLDYLPEGIYQLRVRQSGNFSVLKVNIIR
jgi:hypothetical protein